MCDNPMMSIIIGLIIDVMILQDMYCAASAWFILILQIISTLLRWLQICHLAIAEGVMYANNANRTLCQ